MNILIVDDDDICLEAIKHMLESEGATVSAFNELPDVKTYEPDLIILDLYMPFKSGEDVCKEFKSDDDLKNIPVVMLSSSSDIEDKKRSLAAGAIEYIEKPITKDELLNRIKKYVHIGKLFNSLRSIRNGSNDTR